jgi:hypothetical protein
MKKFQRLGTYLLRILVAFDRLVNALIGGDPVETLSSVAYRKHRDGGRFGFMMWVVNCLFLNMKHCEQAYTADRSRILPH